jgi:hypothetical protein
MGEGVAVDNPGGASMKKPSKKNSADVFFKWARKTISNDEAGRLVQPNETQQQLLSLLNEWYEHASKTLQEHGYDWDHGFHIPKLGGLFSFDEKIIREGKARHAYRVMTQASNVFRLRGNNDECALAAIALGLTVKHACPSEFAEFALDKDAFHERSTGGSNEPLREHKAALLKLYRQQQALGIRQPNKVQLTQDYVNRQPDQASLAGSYDRLLKSLPSHTN